MIGSAGFVTNGAMPIYRADPNSPPSLKARQAMALKDLWALCSSDVNTKKKKQEIVSELLEYGFDINEPICDVGGVKIRLLDVAGEQKDPEFCRFLLDCHANPKLCNAVWVIDDMLTEFDRLHPKIANADIGLGLQATDNRAASIVVPEILGAIPCKAGVATSSSDMQANVENASERNLGRCLYTIATVLLRFCAVVVGGTLYAGAVLVNGGTTLSIYLPFVIPVICAWSVGRLIDALCGNKDFYMTQLLGEIVSAPSVFIDLAMSQLRRVSGLFGYVGASLFFAGLNPNCQNMDIHELASYAWYGFLGNFGKDGDGKTMHSLCYEKVIGPLGPLLMDWFHVDSSRPAS